jgi:hypothetical protein
MKVTDGEISAEDVPQFGIYSFSKVARSNKHEANAKPHRRDAPEVRFGDCDNNCCIF